jgi:CHAT domain-containing protein
LRRAHLVSFPALADDTAAALDQQGSVLAQQRDFAGAFALYRQAMVADPDNDRYAAHAAVASFWLDDRDEAIELFIKAVDLAARQQAWDRIAGYHQRMVQMRYVMPAGANETRTAAAAVPQTPEAQAALARWQALYPQIVSAVHAGRGPDAAEQAQEALALCRQAFGASSLHTLAAHGALGDVLRSSGASDRAAPHYLAAYRGARRTLGSGHPDTLVYLNNMAGALAARGKLKQARRHRRTLVNAALKTLGLQHPITASYLLEQGRVLLALGKRKAARKALGHALQVHQSSLGDGHPNTIAARKILGDMDLEKRPGAAATVYREAHGQARRVLGPGNQVTSELSERLLVALERAGRLPEKSALLDQNIDDARAGGDPSELLAALNRAAQHQQTLGNLQGARDRFAQVLELARSLEGVSQSTLATLINNLAYAEAAVGHYREAEPIYQEALRISIAAVGDRHSETLQIQNNMALLYSSLGQYERARGLYEHLYKTRLKTLEPDDPQRLRSAFNLGMMYFKLSRNDEAKGLVQTALAGHRKLLGPNAPETLSALNGLALINAWSGDYATARTLYEETLRLRTKVLGPHHPDTLITQNNLALFYHHLGDYQRGATMRMEVLRHRRSTLGPTHPRTTDTLNDLAIIYDTVGQHAQAITLYEEALKHAIPVYGKDHPEVIKTRHNMAQTLIRVGRGKEALETTRGVLAAAQKVMGAEHRMTLVFQGNLAWMYDRLGMQDQALLLYEKTLAGKRKVFGPGHPQTTGTLENLTDFHRRQKHLEQADRLSREGLAATATFLEAALWGADVTTRQAILVDREVADAAYLTWFLARRTPDAGDRVLELTLARKGVLRNLAARVNALQRAAHNPRLAASARELEGLRRDLADQAWTGEAADPGRAARMSDLEALMGAEVAAYARGGKRVTPAQVRKRLPRDTALLDYLVYRPASRWEEDRPPARMAVVVAQRGGSRVVDLGLASPVLRVLADFREAIAAPSEDGATRDFARVLHRVLVAPALAAAPEAKALWIVPHGPLHVLPFAALVGPDGRYLVQTHDLVFLSTPRDVVDHHKARDLKSSRPSRAPPVIVAGPDFGPKAGARLPFTALPAALEEGHAVADLLQGGRQPQLLTGSQATEAAVSSVVGPRILHLATHGYVLPARRTGPPQSLLASAGTRSAPSGAADTEAPTLATHASLARAGLALAGANTHQSGDGILTALEVLSMDLRGTELVVLSACDSGLGTVTSGQGVYGLRRAFQEAGARTVISSLWRVSDQATRELMIRLYTRMAKGQSPTAALRAVQRALIGSPQYSDPTYWAPFVAVGR